MIIPVFDLNSVILTSIALTMTLVLVLIVFGAHQHRALVTRWIYGLLLMASGLSLYLISDMVAAHQPDHLFIVAAICLVSLGMSVYVNGIRMLRGYRVYRYLSLVVATTILASNAFLLNMHASMRWTLVINTFVQLWLFVYGCRSLTGKGRDFISHVFWICCSLFAMVVLLISCLIVKLTLADSSQIQHFTDWIIHSYLVLLMGMVFISVTSLLLLVMNVRTQAGLQAIATLDGLTGVLNRRGLQDAASRMQAVSQRIKLPMAMLIVDLDYFKKVNDVYGHLVGDVVLKACADTIRSALRGGDVIGRYGGEEFCILLPNTGEHESTVLAERIRRTIETSPVNIAGVESLSDDTRAIKCTVSVGAVSSETAGYVLDVMFAAADQNLYRAKQSGRNRISSNIDQVLAKPVAKSGKRDSAALTID